MKKIIAFYSFWDEPSKITVLKVLKHLKRNNIVNCELIDVDKNLDLTKKYKVKNLPTVIFLKDEIEYDRKIGLLTEDGILKCYNK